MPGYAKICSGLGEALLANVTVLPILFGDQVLGVIELASFIKLTSRMTSIAKDEGGVVLALYQSRLTPGAVSRQDISVQRNHNVYGSCAAPARPETEEAVE